MSNPNYISTAQENTSRIINYCFLNLAKLTIRMEDNATKNRERRAAAIAKRFHSAEKRTNDVMDFIAFNLPRIIELHNLTAEEVESGKMNSLLVTTFRNFLTKRWEHENVERHYVRAENIITNSEGETMSELNNMPDTQEAYNETIDQLLEAWYEFTKTLTGNKKSLCSFYVPGGKMSAKNLETVQNITGWKKTYIYVVLGKLEDEFKAYVQVNYTKLWSHYED